MHLYLSPDTRSALGSDSNLLCENRALFYDRFADPSLREEPRKAWFERGRKIKVPGEAANRDRSSYFPNGTFLHARLLARLMVNMAGGVMENAGLCLDRYGLPHIPGSAVKGCARRMALQALHDWVAAGSARPSENDIGAPCCEPFNDPAEMLAAICQVFGWVEQDWESKQELAWACGGKLDSIGKTTAEILAQTLHFTIQDTHQATLWKSLPNFAGSIAFLAAYPNRDPGIDLDVVTCHHGDYYEGKKPVASDTEEPVPVIFPAITRQKEGDYFTCPLIPLRRANPELLTFSKTWLTHGLEIFGLGAKTNAGYGWFDASESLNQAVFAKLKAEIERHDAELEHKQRAEKEAAEAKAKSEAKAALVAALEGLSPEEKEDKQLEMLNPHQFDTKVRSFCKEPKKGGPSDDQKLAIVRALRGPRLSYWQDFKTKSTKGDLATVDQAIRALSKTMNLGKMP